MASRVAAHLPRLAILGVVFAFAGGTLAYGAAQRLSATSGKRTVHASTPTLVVPDVTGQAFVFAKGALEDSGFAWRVIGSIHGYAANPVVSQSPAAGTKLKDTGAPTISMSLARSAYAESGEPEDTSPYTGTAIVLPSALVAAKPTAARTTIHKSTGPRNVTHKRTAVKTVVRHKAAVHVKKVAVTKTAAKRPPAFVASGAPKEPLKEMPLPNRARLLSDWLSAHPQPTSGNLHHFLYQHAWVVTGARFGWWHGAAALRLLIADDLKAERLWGVGHKSELVARSALAEVEARSR
jgi:hypothetical protein